MAKELWQYIDSKDNSFKSNPDNWINKLLLLAGPDTKWLLPEGAPEVPLKEIPSEAETNLRLDFRRLRMFMLDANGIDPYPNMKSAKRESLFLDTYQHIPKQEAEFLIAVKDRNVFEKYPWLNT